MSQPSRTKTYDQLESLLAERILVLDGAMGTMIQALKLSDADVRGETLLQSSQGLRRFSDILCLTRSDDITEIHRKYLAAGADIIETNTFGASFVGMEEFQLPRELVREINTAAVLCARRAADEFNERTPYKPRFVAGSIGPTAKQMAISTRVEDPAWRGVTFDEMVDSYYEQVAALVEAGVDLLLPETVIDTLNLKACLFRHRKVFSNDGSPSARDRIRHIRQRRRDVRQRPIGRGVLERALTRAAPGDWHELRPSGLTQCGPHIEELSQVATIPISCYPNAGLPNEMGHYDLGPAAMAQMLGEWADNGWLNIIGGCCGTTPEHIAAIAERVKRNRPHQPPDQPQLAAAQRHAALHATARQQFHHGR